MFNSNDEDKQAELFPDLPGISKQPIRARLGLAKKIVSLSYENIIILSIGLIMLFITCFSLGVERGRQFVQLKTESIELPQEQVQEKPKIESPQPEEEKLKIKAAYVQASPKSSAYIQVASFRKDKYAQEEMQRLKSKGYQSFVTTMRNYKVVCVGGYNNKEEARKALNQLRKMYGDCLLRNK